MSEYASQFGVVRSADPKDPAIRKAKPQPAPRPQKTASVKLGRLLSVALKNVDKPRGR
jgi:hypothetical protein